MTYPLKFRQHILAVKASEGLSLKATSERFCVGVASLSRWLRKIEPQTTRHKPATKLDMDALAADVRVNPNAYQRERAVRFGVSAACIQFALKQMPSKANFSAATEWGSGRMRAVAGVDFVTKLSFWQKIINSDLP